MAMQEWNTAKQWVHSYPQESGELTTYGFYIDAETPPDLLMESAKGGRLGNPDLTDERMEILLVGTKEHCSVIRYPGTIRKGVKAGTIVVRRRSIASCIKTRLENERQWFARSISHEDELAAEYLINRGIDNDLMPMKIEETSVPYVRPGDDVWKIERSKLPYHLEDLIGRDYRQGELKANSHRSWVEVENVRGWPFPALENTYFIAAGEQDIRRSLQLHIQKTLRMPILVDGGRFGGPGKYQHFHGHACFDGKEFKKGKLFLELWGVLLSVGDMMRNSLEFAGFFCDEYGQKRYIPNSVLHESLVFGIRVCNLANITFPGIRVPGYM